MDTPHFVPIAARMSWVTTGNIAAIIDRQKVLTADALEEYMVYVFAKYEINAIKMIVMQLPKSTPANAGKTQCVSGPLDLRRFFQLWASTTDYKSILPTTQTKIEI